MPKSRKRKLSDKKKAQLERTLELQRTLALIQGGKLRSTPKSSKYTRGISTRARTVRETFVKDAKTEEGYTKFYKLLYSSSKRQESETYEQYRERLWLRGQAMKLWKQSFKNRQPNRILKYA